MADTATYGDTANARSHLFLCSGNTVTATAYSCFFGIFCEPIGWVTFTTTTIGLAQDPDGSARSVSQVSLLQDFLPDGPNPEAILSVPMQVSMDCTPAAGLGTACENDRPEGMTMPLAEWMTYQGGVPFNLTGPDGDGVGADLLSFYNFDTRLTLTDNGSTTTFWAAGHRVGLGVSAPQTAPTRTTTGPPPPPIASLCPLHLSGGHRGRTARTRARLTRARSKACGQRGRFIVSTVEASPLPVHLAPDGTIGTGAVT